MALRTFIRDYIDSFGQNNITVFYENKWQHRDYPKFDILIVDEYQDFSANDILNVIANSTQGRYECKSLRIKCVRTL